MAYVEPGAMNVTKAIGEVVHGLRGQTMQNVMTAFCGVRTAARGWMICAPDVHPVTCAGCKEVMGRQADGIRRAAGP